MNRTVCIIGPGRVGTALYRDIARSGEYSCQEPVTHAQALSGRFPTAQIYCITTPDSAIVSTAQQLAACPAFSKDAVVLHCSGVHGSTLLSGQGIFHAASFHPARSIGHADGSFHGAVVAIEGESVAVETASLLAQALGAEPVIIAAEKKASYHAATVFAANFIPALLSVAESLLCKAGYSAVSAHRIALDLSRSALANVEQRGLPDGLTGPVARGDDATIALHVRALESNPEFRELYVNLTKQLQKIVANDTDPGSSRRD